MKSLDSSRVRKIELPEIIIDKELLEEKGKTAKINPNSHNVYLALVYDCYGTEIYLIITKEKDKERVEELLGTIGEIAIYPLN
ncbi:MAG TPA: hypothetical protein ENF99_00965 [Candidatus Aenigmarchaeota archaeon]|nr:hypothetical protein [Candidatus Aenigmarchaeota archaeon]